MMKWDEFAEYIEADAQNRRDIMVKPSDLGFSIKDDKITLTVRDEHVTPTKHALRQFCQRAFLPTSILSLMPGEEVAGGKFTRDIVDGDSLVFVLNNGIRRLNHDKQYRVRLNTGVCRAFLTESYTPVDNRWYVDVLREIIPDGDIVHGERSNSDTIYANVLIPDSLRAEDDSDYGGMLSISNCEIGIRKLAQYPSVYRSICSNGMIFGQEKGEIFSKVHKGKIDLEDLRRKIIENVESKVKLLDEHIRKLLAARNKVIPADITVPQVLYACVKTYGLTSKQAVSLFEEFKHEKGNRNLFGVVNTITRAGQRFDNETWVKFDALAGELVENPRKWDAILLRSKSYSQEEISKALEKALRGTLVA